MPAQTQALDNLAVNTIRMLSIDAIQKANSGHPGLPMGCAPLAYVLYQKILKHNPSNPGWFNRDRFILSAGHGSMLLYSALHLSGYDISMDDIKNFRQWKSKTAGHPEYGLAEGVETTTGPLGQGFANAVGMAVAQAFLSSFFNRDGFKVIDNYIYALCSDGDLMEGISHEAASIAGHFRLNKLIVFYDDNRITIDGHTSITFSDDVKKRFESYNWNVLSIDDINDLNSIEKAVSAAKSSLKPNLIITRSHIGYGSPNKQDSSAVHGAPLGEEEVKLTKKNLNWPEDKFFYVPDEVYRLFDSIKERGFEYEKEWKLLLDSYKEKYPNKAKILTNLFEGKFGDEWKAHLPLFEENPKGIATRVASGNIINSIAEYLPTLIGGSADLAASNNTLIKDSKLFSAENYSGRNIPFGIREHSMAGILNGMALYGGVIPFGGTFLVFSDYMKPSIRLAALMKLKVIYVFTHDSIGLGEDGPTHQPVEHIASLRSIPGLLVIRPADANETKYAWLAALEYNDGPVAIVLTRQNHPLISDDASKAKGLLNGAYVIYDSDSFPDLIIMASGSEVSYSFKAAMELEKQKIKVRIVSFPSWELFEKQPESYKQQVLPKEVLARVSVEAGVKHGWEKYIGDFGEAVSIDRFGSSAPFEVLFEKYGFNSENIIRTCLKSISKAKQR
jgi:transketolase